MSEQRPPRSPRTLRLLNTLEEIYTDKTQPTPERIGAAALTAQILGIPTDILVSAPNAWRSGLARVRFRVNKKARELDKEGKKRKPRSLRQDLQRIRAMQSEGK